MRVTHNSIVFIEHQQGCKVDAMIQQVKIENSQLNLNFRETVSNFLVEVCPVQTLSSQLLTDLLYIEMLFCSQGKGES